MVKEVKSKIYKAVKKNGKCVIVRKQQKPKPVIGRKTIKIRPPTIPQIPVMFGYLSQPMRQQLLTSTQNIAKQAAVDLQKPVSQIDDKLKTPVKSETPKKLDFKETTKDLSDKQKKKVAERVAKRLIKYNETLASKLRMTKNSEIRRKIMGEINDIKQEIADVSASSSSTDKDASATSTADQDGTGSSENVGMYESEIEREMADDPEFEGCIASDEVLTLPHDKPVFSCIMNTDPRSKPGQHWVAIRVDTKTDNQVCYYNPFGEDPSPQFEIDIKTLVDRMKVPHMLKFKVNNVKNQQLSSNRCAVHCINFLRKMKNNMSFQDATGFKIPENIDNSSKMEKEAKKLQKTFKLI